MFKDLSKLKEKANKKEYKGYMFVFILTMVLLRFVSELGSNIPTFIQSSVIKEFFVLNKGLSYNEGLSNYTVVSLSCSSVYILAVLYKPLADKIGRKTIVVINAIGILIGFLFFRSSLNFYIYAAGLAITTMFMQNDVQMIYILETVNNKNSAKVFGIVKSAGILGLIIIPFLREFVMENDSRLWRNVFIGPIILTIVVVLLMVFLLKESKVFLNKRINVLDGIKENNNKENISLKESIKYIIKNKQLRIQIIAYISYGLCSMAAYMYVESLMTQNGMNTVDVTKALYVYPVVYAILSFLAGFIADKYGRKKVVVPCGLMVAVGFVLFIASIKSSLNPFFVGFLNGIYLGSYWIMGDYISFLFIENVPTEMRTSVLTGSNILMMLGMIFGVTLEIILIRIIGLTFASLIIIVPCSLISALIILFKIKETKGTNLELIERE